MPFENFYNESEKSAHRWQILFGIVFFLIIGYYVIPYLVSVIASFNSNMTQTLTKFPAKAKLKRQVDELCANLPEPEKFHFVDNEPPVDYLDSTLVIYRYRSERRFEEIMPAFLVWFSENGWTPVPGSELRFQKGDQTIFLSVEPNDFFSIYSIYCSEKND